MKNEDLINEAMKKKLPIVLHAKEKLSTPADFFNSSELKSLFAYALNYLRVTESPVDIICESYQNDHKAGIKMIKENFLDLAKKIEKRDEQFTISVSTTETHNLILSISVTARKS